jgi:predicted nucleic acid-binding protein
VRRVSLDSNVLVYTVDRQDRRHARAVELLARAVRGDCVLSIQSVAEFYHVVTRKHLASTDEAAAQVEDMLASFPWQSQDAESLQRAISLARQHSISFWDAMLCATVQGAGCEILLSEDLQDGRQLDGLQIVDPFAPANDRLVDLFLPRPEAEP